MNMCVVNTRYSACAETSAGRSACTRSTDPSGYRASARRRPSRADRDGSRVSFLKERGRSRMLGRLGWRPCFLRRCMGKRQRGVGVQDRPEADREAAVGPGGPRRTGGCCSARRKVLGCCSSCRSAGGSVGVCSPAPVASASGQARVRAVGHSFAASGGGMEWCDRGGPAGRGQSRRRPRQGWVRQQTIRAQPGDLGQTQNDPRPAGERWSSCWCWRLGEAAHLAIA